MLFRAEYEEASGISGQKNVPTREVSAGGPAPTGDRPWALCKRQGVETGRSSQELVPITC